MKRTALAFATLAMLTGGAIAQSPSGTIMEHYRAYRIALEQNDMTTAEREAGAALEASEARDGDGGRTAVLALNLAMVRLQSNHGAEALAPAVRALSLAQTRGADSGIDLGLATVVHGRADLAANGAPAAARLLAVLEGHRNSDPSAAIHLAAAQLGHWALDASNYRIARAAWAIAAESTVGSGDDRALAFARARIGEGAAIFLGEVRRGYRRMDQSEALEAWRAFSEARVALESMAEIASADGSVTSAQYNYAEALAWREALRAKLVSNGQEVPTASTEAQGDADGFKEMPAPVALTRPRCLLQTELMRMPRYPSSAAAVGHIGSVVVRLVINAEGNVTNREIVLGVGDRSLMLATERVLGEWVVRRHDGSPANCRMEMSVFRTVTFVMG